MSSDQRRRGENFLNLHLRPGTFVIPNPFDAGSAKILAAAGFEALATSSAGFAFSQGVADHGIGRAGMLAHLEAIASATELPISADLGRGYADDPAGVAECIALAAKSGVVGASIEDATADSHQPLYPLELAAERIEAAAKAAKALPFPFVLTARAENFLVGNDDLHDVIVRLRAYQDAGADVLYAPGLTNPADIALVVRSIDRPLNVLAYPNMTRQGLAEIGVKRISVGSWIALSAYGATFRAAAEMHTAGTFSFAESAMAFGAMHDMMEPH